jgi:hypothetical protein
VSAALLAEDFPPPPAEAVGDHSLYRVVVRMRGELARAGTPERRRQVLLALVALEFGEGVAQTLRGGGK